MIKIQNIIQQKLWKHYSKFNIDYLKCLKLWKGVGSGMHNFKWYKVAELSEISIKNIIFALRRGDHKDDQLMSRAHQLVIFINKSPSL